MSKYDPIKFWKESITKVPKICQSCEELIGAGDIYYHEQLTDKKINFIGKKNCLKCFKSQTKSGNC
jgi:hypothetical protein